MRIEDALDELEGMLLIDGPQGVSKYLEGLIEIHPDPFRLVSNRLDRLVPGWKNDKTAISTATIAASVMFMVMSDG